MLYSTMEEIRTAAEKDIARNGAGQENWRDAGRNSLVKYICSLLNSAKNYLSISQKQRKRHESRGLQGKEEKFTWTKRNQLLLSVGAKCVYILSMKLSRWLTTVHDYEWLDDLTDSPVFFIYNVSSGPAADS